jgi:hypothetical protein
MKIFSRLIQSIAVLAVLAGLAGCHRVNVDAGTEAVLTEKPWFGGHGGVDPEPVTTGSTVVAMSTSATVISMVPETQHVVFDDYSSRDNIMLDFDTAVQLQVTNSVSLVKNFGPNWFQNNIQSQYAAMVREVVKGQTMTDMMSNAKTSTTMDKELTDQLTAFVKANNLPWAGPSRTRWCSIRSMKQPVNSSA